MYTTLVKKSGGITLHSNQPADIPEGLNVNMRDRVIFQGYSEAFLKSDEFLKPALFLTDSKRYGKIYVSPTMLKCHPVIHNDTLLGSSMVVFVTQGVKTFVVLIQPVGVPFLMNPSGHRLFNETSSACAVRKVKAKTGLKIGRTRRLANWTFDTRFGGLKWKGRTQAYHCQTECPSYWNLDQDINKFASPAASVEQIVVIDMEMFSSTHIQPTINQHHHACILEAYQRRNGYQNLNSFAWLRPTSHDS